MDKWQHDYEYCKDLIAGLRKLVKKVPGLEKLSVRIKDYDGFGVKEKVLVFDSPSVFSGPQKVMAEFVLNVVGRSTDEVWIVDDLPDNPRVHVGAIEDMILKYYEFYCYSKEYREMLGNVDGVLVANLVAKVNNRSEYRKNYEKPQVV